MTDDAHSAPTPSPERVRVEGASAPRRFDALPILYLVGFVVLASALVYLWRHPGGGGTLVAQDPGRVNTLQEQVRTLTARLTALEGRPAPDLGPLSARIEALEKRPAGSGPAPDLAPLQARIAELERRPAPAPGAPPVNLAPVEARIAALEGRPPPPPVDLGPLNARIAALAAKQGADAAALSGRLDSIEGQIRSAAAAATARLDPLEARLGAAEQQGRQLAGQLGGIAERAQRISRLQVAGAALEAGQRLGDIPGAPPALARFAHDAPPTEAALRLSFNQAADAAQRASQPAIMDNQPFASRMWTRAQQIVTVRQGDRVLLGDPISGVLAHARQSLEAGDLPGAVSALDGLAGPAAAAMAGWVGQARALLEARAALAGMAAQN